MGPHQSALTYSVGSRQRAGGSGIATQRPTSLFVSLFSSHASYSRERCWHSLRLMWPVSPQATLFLLCTARKPAAAESAAIVCSLGPKYHYLPNISGSRSCILSKNPAVPALPAPYVFALRFAMRQSDLSSWQRARNFESTTLMGRWQEQRTCRIYLEEVLQLQGPPLCWPEAPTS